MSLLPPTIGYLTAIIKTKLENRSTGTSRGKGEGEG